tara:strand:- start:389 stop:796 length:408 start_codon:yes stop_codon:yes gene_type:complete
MSLSNLDKTHLDELLLSLNSSNNTQLNRLEAVKANHAEYAQLKLIAKQINNLRQEALKIIDDSVKQNELHQIKTGFKLVSGNNYYLYQKEKDDNPNIKYFSMIAPSEWCKSQTTFNDKFLGKYFYDYDKQFIKTQ